MGNLRGRPFHPQRQPCRCSCPLVHRPPRTIINASSSCHQRAYLLCRTTTSKPPAAAIEAECLHLGAADGITLRLWKSCCSPTQLVLPLERLSQLRLQVWPRRPPLVVGHECLTPETHQAPRAIDVIAVFHACAISAMWMTCSTTAILPPRLQR